MMERPEINVLEDIENIESNDFKQRRNKRYAFFNHGKNGFNKKRKRVTKDSLEKSTWTKGQVDNLVEANTNLQRDISYMKKDLLTLINYILLREHGNTIDEEMSEGVDRIMDIYSNLSYTVDRKEIERNNEWTTIKKV
jgi:hypothetical protein